MGLDPAGSQLVTRLDPYLISIEQSTSTPGSYALSPIAVHRYRTNPGAVSVMLDASERLFAWQEPDLPNDLFFTIGDSPFLISLASDREAYFSLTPAQRDLLVQELPWLRLRRFAGAPG